MPPKDYHEPPQSSGPGPGLPGRRPRALLTWIILGAVAVLLLLRLSPGLRTSEKVDQNDFLKHAGQDLYSKVEQVGNTFYGELHQPRKGITKEETSTAPEDDGFREQLREMGVTLASYKEPSRLIGNLLVYLVPMFIMIAIIYFLFIRPMRASGGPGGVLSFGKSTAKLVTKERTGVTFENVAGIEEAKAEVTEIIEFLKDPQRFERLGGRVPRGLLLIGAPGTGKTLLAKAIAGEANVPFFSISGSDFVEMFVGVGASRVRDLFRQAKESAPCIIFLDEIDAVGRRRGHGWGGGHDEREQTLNAILVEMDGFQTDTRIIVMAATNRPDVLDPALLRPGRFDRQVFVDLPDLNGREAILKVHARKVKLAEAVNFRDLARGTPMFTGADLEAVINEAAILATMRGKDAVDMDDFWEARDKTKWGRQKTSRIMNEDDKKVAAYHESGHALVAKLLPEMEPLHKVTIVPRGMALGATMVLPERDRYTMQRKQVLANAMYAFGGRVAEEMFCDDITSGAEDDIRRASELIRRMVREWGMSDKIGPISYANSEDKLYGGEVVISKGYSEATAIEIDKEIRRIVDECYQKTRELLEEHREDAEKIAQALLRYEVLDTREVDLLLTGGDLEAKKTKDKETAAQRQAKAEEETSSPQSKPTQERTTELDEGLQARPA